MPGFGRWSTQALARAGIHTLEDLRQRDPYDVYRELKSKVPNVGLNLLYGIFAAIDGCHWRDVQRERRTEILLRLDELGLAPK